jgi:hypothetical protein
MTTISCDACGQEYKQRCWGDPERNELPYDGWVLPYKHFGYYNGFDDVIDVLVGGKEYEHWWICHDCVVKFLTAFPLLGEKVGRGCHPIEHKGDIGTDEKPCCKWAWTSNTKRDADGKIIGHETFFATDAGTWELREEHSK